MSRPQGTRRPTEAGRVGRLLARLARRGAVFLVGVALLLAGAVMLFIPGPGIATMLLGLAVLATEFAWAKRVLAWARRHAAALGGRARARLPGGARRREDARRDRRR